MHIPSITSNEGSTLAHRLSFGAREFFDEQAAWELSQQFLQGPSGVLQ
ncbi:MAG: hypothetical protein ACR2KT_12290 [Methylocella sp.]